MMNAVTLKTSCLLSLCLGISFCALQGQQIRTLSARNALEQIASRFGPDTVGWIAELRGTGGQPQPLQWDVVAYDSRAPGLLHHFRASAGMVQDGGPDSRRYPNDVPNGFFTLANIGVDSIAAFTIAEAEARKARQGFDSCDYFLQKREFSSEAVWKLDLVDANHRLVGSVFISAANGQVYRTVWVKRDSISGFPVFTDSLSPRSKPFTGITDGNTLPPDPGFAGITAPPSTLQRPPFTPVSPEGTIRQAPGQNPESAPRNGSIFKEFPTEGGGSSRPTPNQPFNPLDPAPPVTEPAPVLRRTPVDPAITGPVPPIDVPDTGGSSERIPPPPVPR